MRNFTTVYSCPRQVAEALPEFRYLGIARLHLIYVAPHVRIQ